MAADLGYNAVMRAIERRSYLRIHDEAHVGALVIAEEQMRRQPVESLLGLDRTFALRKDLYRLELEARELRREISAIDRPLGSFLHNLNLRMEMLTSVIVDAGATATSNILDLSPAGLSYRSGILYSTNDLLAFKLTFLQGSLGIAGFGRVSYSLLEDNDIENKTMYRIGVQFIPGDPTIEALIARHISALQAEQRRQRLHKTLPD